MVTDPLGLEGQWDLGPMVSSQVLVLGSLRPEGGLGRVGDDHRKMVPSWHNGRDLTNTSIPRRRCGFASPPHSQ